MEGCLHSLVVYVVYAKRVDRPRRATRLHRIDADDTVGPFKKMQRIQHGGSDLDGKNPARQHPSEFPDGMDSDAVVFQEDIT